MCYLLLTLDRRRPSARLNQLMSSQPPSQPHSTSSSSFDVYVSKDTFKFNAAHFVAFQSYRERLHGHNYRVGIRLVGSHFVGRDGYVLDFGVVKDVCKSVCKRMNEHFLCPVYSDVMDVRVDDASVQLTCHVDGSTFVFPRKDVLLLPIVHATAEEIAVYLWSELLDGFRGDYLTQRGIQTMEVTVAEAPGQEATFRLSIADALAKGGAGDGSGRQKLDVRAFITEGALVPMPCLDENDAARRAKAPKSAASVTSGCSNGDCSCRGSSVALFSQQLHKISQAINDGVLKPGSNVTPDDLERLIATTDAT
jgi:dihydroneopterin triphosphate aldolase (PTPS-III) / 6-pyruvoyltetrahydropterin synthase